MRTHAVVLSAALFAIGGLALAASRAGADEEAPDVLRLSREIRLLRMDVDYLLLREAALTKAALSAETVAQHAEGGARDARTQGFESAGPNPASKTTILRTFESIARDLRQSLPRPSKGESELKGQADILRRELLGR
jgi:hypothetical protein